MNDRQQDFADNYLICQNVYEAAIKAGYSESYAKTNAHKLLENVSIKKYLDGKRKRKSEQHDITLDKQLKKLETVFALATEGERPDFKAAVQAISEQNKMLGFHAETKLKQEVKLSGDKNNPIAEKIEITVNKTYDSKP